MNTGAKEILDKAWDSINALRETHEVADGFARADVCARLRKSIKLLDSLMYDLAQELISAPEGPVA